MTTTGEFTWNEVRPGDMIVCGYLNCKTPTDSELVISIVYEDDHYCSVHVLDLWCDDGSCTIREQRRQRDHKVFIDDLDFVVRDGVEIARGTK